MNEQEIRAEIMRQGIVLHPQQEKGILLGALKDYMVATNYIHDECVNESDKKEQVEEICLIQLVIDKIKED